MRIGILAFHGDVTEHEKALLDAAKKLKITLDVVSVRDKSSVKNLDGLIIPGGESPTMQKLAERAGIWNELKKIKNIFGTCAGAVLLAKDVGNKSYGQKTLALMDITLDRNAYGRQAESFEKTIPTTFGKINAVFIRAPRITSIGKNVTSLASDQGEILASEQKGLGRYYLATCFHPELTTSLFHVHFLKHIKK